MSLRNMLTSHHLSAPESKWDVFNFPPTGKELIQEYNKKHMSKPKFKVGDKVKVDWMLLKKDNEYKYIMLSMMFVFPKDVKVESYIGGSKKKYTTTINSKKIVFEEKHLTLANKSITGKSKCKFKKLEEVI